MAITRILLFLVLMAGVSWAQNTAVTPPNAPVVLQPDLYNAIWNYIVQAECKNPLQLLNALQQARQLSEPHKLPDPATPEKK